MISTPISSFPSLINQPATTTIRGWVYNFRSSGKIMFLQIRDGSGFTQAIVDQGQVSESEWEKAKEITLETSVILTGTVAKHPKKDEYELHVSEVNIVQVAQEFPIGKKEHGPDFLLDHRHLWLRSPSQWAIQRIRNTIINATYAYFNENGFIKIDAPILTPNACEGTTELFEMDYFNEGANEEHPSSGKVSAAADGRGVDPLGKGAPESITSSAGKAYLSQSGQLYIEAAIFSVGRCFDFGPVFRAEKSKTRRHLTEFWMMDAEAAFVEHEENMAIQEGLICRIVRDVLEKNTNELTILERDLEPLKKIQAPFPRLTHMEAVKKLRELGSDIGDLDDLGADDETILTKQFDQPIFIEKYPAVVKSFYMKRDPTDPQYALNDDLLAPEGYGEIIGGSQREDDYDVILQRIKEHNLPEEYFDWYLDLRKYGSVPHSGFGLGLERVVTWLCGIHHLRESIPFPRMINRIRP